MYYSAARPNICHHHSAALILQGTFPPLYGVSQQGQLAIVELLVSRGARIDQPCDVRLIICMHANYWESQSDPYIHHSCINIARVVYMCVCSDTHMYFCAHMLIMHVHIYCSRQ